MASVSIIKKRAAEFTSKGEYKEAVKEYKKLLRVNENDPGNHNLLGDLYLKMGSKKLAFEEFEKAVELYTTEEFFSNAVAVAKKVLRLDANQAIIYKQLGELYAKQGLLGDAITNLMDYADRKKAEGSMEEVCTSYEKAIEWMPKRVDLRMALADLYVTQMKNDEAIKVLREVADLFREQEKYENAEGIEQRIRDLGGVVEEIPSVEPSLVETPSTPEPTETSQPPVEEIRFEQMETVAEEEFTLDSTPPKEEEVPGFEEGIPEVDTTLTIDKKEMKEAPGIEEGIPGGETTITIDEKEMEEAPVSASAESKNETTLSFDDMITQQGETLEETEEPLFKTSPTDVESYVELGEMCLSIGSEEEAIDHFYMAADSYLKDESFDKAKEIYLRIALLRPKELRSRQNILQISIDHGNKKEKIQAHLDLGECLLLRGTEDEAQSIYQNLLQIDPKNSIALERAGSPDSGEEIQMQDILSSAMEPDTLLEEFRDGLDQTLEKGDTSSYYDLGITYKEMGLLDEAIESLQKASEGNKEKLKALEMLGLCYLEKGEAESAAFQLIQGLRLDGYSPEETIGLQYHLGVAYEKMDQKKKALEAYEAAAKVNPKFRDLAKKLKALQEETTGVIRRDKKRRERISYV